MKYKKRKRKLLYRKCLISYKNKWITRWDYIVVILALANCVMVPLEIAVELDYTKTWQYFVYSIITDIIFIMDIFVSFNTTLKENSIEITDRTIIAMNYLKGTFTIDFISAFPVDVISLMLKDLSSRQLKLFSLLKLVRMLRLSRIIRALKVPRGLKA